VEKVCYVKNMTRKKPSESQDESIQPVKTSEVINSPKLPSDAQLLMKLQ
jgi:hypothetical protein